MEIRRADERGRANFGWLDSRHTFSFGSYYDEQHMGFSVLRVINDDKVTAGAGFDTHGHKDMEILSYVTSGVIEHKDSMGHVQTLPSGEYQLMSAGKGVYHSEYNGSEHHDLTFLQIWIVPREQGGAPRYQQKAFGNEAGITPIVTPDGANGTLQIKQDASVSQWIVSAGTEQTVQTSQTKQYYLHIVRGTMLLNEQKLFAGDGAKLKSVESLTAKSVENEEVMALLFELP